MGATALTDYLGHTHVRTENPRILSLVPSLTELLFDLDLEEHIVGRTHYCIHPLERVSNIPSVGGTKKIKRDRVQELAPTHALLNVDENPQEMADELRDMGIEVIVTHPMHPDDNIVLYRLIGGVFGKLEIAENLVAGFQKARAEIAPLSQAPEIKALYLIWKDPWMAIRADTYIGNYLSLANIEVVAPGAKKAAGDAARYPEIALDEKTLSEVDVVLFSSEPYSFGVGDIAAFQSAFPDHAEKAHLIDGEMTSWYGSRAIAGLRYLREFSEAVRA